MPKVAGIGKEEPRAINFRNEIDLVVGEQIELLARDQQFVLNARFFPGENVSAHVAINPQLNQPVQLFLQSDNLTRQPVLFLRADGNS